MTRQNPLCCGLVDRRTLERVLLRRELITVRAFDRAVAVKVGYYGDRVVNVYPEYEDCTVRPPSVLVAPLSVFYH